MVGGILAGEVRSVLEPSPELGLGREEAVLYRGSLRMLGAGAIAYAVFAPVFWAFGVPEIARLNVAIVIWLVVGMSVVRGGRVALGTAFGTSAVMVHGCLATVMLGWDAGFQYQLLVAMMMQALAVPLSLRGRAVTAGLCAGLYILLELGTATLAPIRELGEGQTQVFLAMNLVSSIGLLWFLGLYYSAGVERTREERDEAQQQADRALDETHAIVDHMAEGLVAVGSDGELRTVNASLREMLGLGPGVIEKSRLPEGVLSVAALAVESDELRLTEFALPDERIGIAVATPIARLGGAVVLVRDVTVEREIDRMKTDFTAVVSHELRTPLTSVLGFTKVIQSRLEERVFPHTNMAERRTARAVKQVRGNLDIILQEGRRLGDLINDVLDVAKMESGQMTYADDVLDAASLVERSVVAASGLFDGDVQLVADVQPDLPSLRGDGDRLLQVLLNLISNAAKFTEVGEVRVTAAERNGGVRMQVIDTGAGIPAVECESIFERFHQVEASGGRRPMGTGLGLPICRHIVESHGGTIHATSVMGSGTTLTVDLPGAS